MEAVIKVMIRKENWKNAWKWVLLRVLLFFHSCSDFPHFSLPVWLLKFLLTFLYGICSVLSLIILYYRVIFWHLAFTMPFEDFLPELVSTTYALRMENSLALRLRYPPGSATAPIIAALARGANANVYSTPSPHGRNSKNKVSERAVDEQSRWDTAFFRTNGMRYGAQKASPADLTTRIIPTFQKLHLIYHCTCCRSFCRSLWSIPRMLVSCQSSSLSNWFFFVLINVVIAASTGPYECYARNRWIWSDAHGCADQMYYRAEE